MRRLVDDLLDAAQAVQSRLSLQLAPLDLVELVRTTALDQAESFANSRLALAVRVPPQPLWSRADGARLAQALTNLLQNARKFSPPGTRVSVELQGSAEQAILEVKDEGVGIEPELLPRLFEPFTQGDRSLARSQGGLGLGLSITRAIARLHGGDVTAHSDGHGRGALFRFTLPLTAVEQADASEPQWPVSSRKRVLVVEDNRDAAEMLALLLNTFGHDVRLAHHAEEALQVLDDWNAQVILSDIGLPDVDGFALAQRIRARGNPTLRPLLVAISGYGREIDRARARDAGFDRYLTKPVDGRALADALTTS
jgi:two-component system CheB/CheR fusion protein